VEPEFSLLSFPHPLGGPASYFVKTVADTDSEVASYCCFYLVSYCISSSLFVTYVLYQRLVGSLLVVCYSVNECVNNYSVT
jgi:hypothetical protein